MRPKIKICGVTNAEDALHAVRCGADYVGLNFYPRSPRFVTRGEALKVRQAVGMRAVMVGVFVNAPLSEMQVLDRELGLDRIQLHGNEGVKTVARFGHRAIKAFRMGPEFDAADIEPFSMAGSFLFDTPSAIAGRGEEGQELYGGSGKSWKYGSIVPLLSAGSPVFVAGGIGPDNIVEVMRAVPGAHAIDVCSGVEKEPGIKDPDLVEALFREIRKAN